MFANMCRGTKCSNEGDRERGGVPGIFGLNFSFNIYVIGGTIRIQPLFKELQKLAVLSRYVVSRVAKTAIFYS